MRCSKKIKTRDSRKLDALENIMSYSTLDYCGNEVELLFSEKCKTLIFCVHLFFAFCYSKYFGANFYAFCRIFSIQYLNTDYKCYLMLTAYVFAVMKKSLNKRKIHAGKSFMFFSMGF